MSILQEPAQALASGEDATAIAGLTAAFDVQRRAFAVDRAPSLEVRRERVGRIAPMMIANRERISAALAQDFGAHPTGAADLIETLAVVGRVQYVLDNLEAWMAPQPRPMDAGLFGTAHAYVEMQPKGVVGNMIPWNFPFDIGVGPMVEMLAAGNRVILKPSEHAPACAALLREMVSEHFSPDLVYVAVGGLDLAVRAVALASTRAFARAARFSKPDEIALVFCGSKKSLASGAPMAAALFPAATAGVLITPLMLFHQFQLLACAQIARRYAARRETA